MGFSKDFHETKYIINIFLSLFINQHIHTDKLNAVYLDGDDTGTTKALKKVCRTKQINLVSPNFDEKICKKLKKQNVFSPMMDINDFIREKSLFSWFFMDYCGTFKEEYLSDFEKIIKGRKDRVVFAVTFDRRDRNQKYNIYEIYSKYKDILNENGNTFYSTLILYGNPKGNHSNMSNLIFIINMDTSKDFILSFHKKDVEESINNYMIIPSRNGIEGLRFLVEDYLKISYEMFMLYLRETYGKNVYEGTKNMLETKTLESDEPLESYFEKVVIENGVVKIQKTIQKKRVCSKCGQSGHNKATCRQTKYRKSKQVICRKRKCSNCGKSGHYVSTCKNYKKYDLIKEKNNYVFL